jgi:hypothetical protein
MGTGPNLWAVARLHIAAGMQGHTIMNSIGSYCDCRAILWNLSVRTLNSISSYRKSVWSQNILHRFVSWISRVVSWRKSWYEPIIGASSVHYPNRVVSLETDTYLWDRLYYEFRLFYLNLPGNWHILAPPRCWKRTCPVHKRRHSFGSSYFSIIHQIFSVTWRVKFLYICMSWYFDGWPWKIFTCTCTPWACSEICV